MPYTPPNKKIYVVSLSECDILQKAKIHAEKFAKDPKHKLCSILVHSGVPIGVGVNGNDYHEKHGCERQRLGVPSGKDHHLCPGCDPKFHSEQTAIDDALSKSPTKIIKGFDLYMWGHYHCCRSCWEKMLQHGVRDVYIAKEIFDARKELWGEDDSELDLSQYIHASPETVERCRKQSEDYGWSDWNEFKVTCPHCEAVNDFTGDNWRDEMIDDATTFDVDCRVCGKEISIRTEAQYRHSVFPF